MVAYRVALYEKFEEGELVEVHDLKRDPECFYNIANTISIARIQYLLDNIKERHKEIQNHTQLFLSKYLVNN